MATSGESLDENLENYKAQLKQVEGALLIDENNEDLKKLQQDLLEVIELTEELSQMNEAPPAVAATSVPDSSSSSSSSSTTTNSTTTTATTVPVKKEWKSGDRCKALRKTDGQYHFATVDMIADDKISCTIKFDNSGSVDVVKLSSLEVVQEDIQPQASTTSDNIQSKNNKLTKEEIEKRREIKKKKLLKKKQRMKDFEEARETGKNKWQNFCKKGSLKGKNKVKGLNKKSIFASCEDGKGKKKGTSQDVDVKNQIGVGTCGTSGRTMTSYTPASVYMYKK